MKYAYLLEKPTFVSEQYPSFAMNLHALAYVKILTLHPNSAFKQQKSNRWYV